MGISCRIRITILQRSVWSISNSQKFQKQFTESYPFTSAQRFAAHALNGTSVKKISYFKLLLFTSSTSPTVFFFEHLYTIAADHRQVRFYGKPHASLPGCGGIKNLSKHCNNTSSRNFSFYFSCGLIDMRWRVDLMLCKSETEREEWQARYKFQIRRSS